MLGTALATETGVLVAEGHLKQGCRKHQAERNKRYVQYKHKYKKIYVCC